MARVVGGSGWRRESVTIPTGGDPSPELPGSGGCPAGVPAAQAGVVGSAGWREHTDSELVASADGMNDRQKSELAHASWRSRRLNTIICTRRRHTARTSLNEVGRVLNTRWATA